MARIDDSGLVSGDVGASMDFIWKVLHDWAEFYAGTDITDDWDNICTAMAWIGEALEEGLVVIVLVDEDGGDDAPDIGY